MTGILGAINYSRGDFCCILILLNMMIHVFRNQPNTRLNRIFADLIGWMMIYITAYSSAGIFKYGFFVPSRGLYNFVVMMVMISQTMVAYRWLCYSEMKQNAPWRNNIRARIASAIPVILFCIASIASIWTKWIFYIDENLEYRRGSIFILQYLIVGSYMLITSIKALINSRRKENYVRSRELFGIFTFIIPPAIATFLQAIIPMGVFLVGYGFTIAIIMVYLSDTQHQISQDGLTKLNNRTHMSQFLQQRMEESNHKHLYLLIIDANSFKSINDIFGHVEGDRALKVIANALTKAASEYSCYVSRYGGDEFIVIYETDNPKDMSALRRSINGHLRLENDREKLPYTLTVSMGFAELNDNIKTIPDFIKAADERLMEEKEKIHGKKLL